MVAATPLVKEEGAAAVGGGAHTDASCRESAKL